MKNKKKKIENRNPLKAFLIGHRKMPLFVFLFIFFVLAGLGLFYCLFQEDDVLLSSGVDYETMKKEEMEIVIKEMVKGYPIERMIPAIMKQEPKVIAFLIGMGKKESNWGKRSPKFEGDDCYNYWGYRGPNRVGSGGHSCFASPEEAVGIVGKRITYLVEEKKLDNPDKMIVWKCGSSCATHSEQSVAKWISDVGIYFKKLTQ
jgi:hypothetical protein